MKVWRLSKKRYAEAAFTGEGARVLGGRWNTVGVPMVYTSESLSLAAMEFFVHLDGEDEPADLVTVAAELPDERQAMAAQREAILAALPDGWQQMGIRESQRIGDEWVRSQSSLAMMVPSAVIDGEWNALINPLHRDAARIKILEANPFRFDARMFKKKG